MNLTEFADSVATDLGRPFDHMLLENIKVHFIEKRAIFLARDPNSKGKFPLEAVQDLGTLEVKEYNDKNVLLGLDTCKLKRSVDRIPETVRIGKLKRGLFFVGEQDKVTQFDYLTPEEILLEPYRRVPRSRVVYTEIDRYLYILNFDAQTINVRDVFVDPRAAYPFSTKAKAYVGSDEDFPIPGDLIPLIRTELFKQLGALNREPQTTIEPDAERS